MGVEAPIRNRLEIGDQAIHRTQGGSGHQPALTEFHIDGTMRFVRAEIALSSSTPQPAYFDAKNAEVLVEGLYWVPSGIVHAGPSGIVQSASWASFTILPASRVAVATIEMFVPDAGGWVGRVEAVGDARRVSLGFRLMRFDPVAGFDLSVGMLNVHDAFVMDYHVLQES